MPKIANWTKLDKDEYDEREFPAVWKNNENSDINVVVKKEYGLSQVKYQVYCVSTTSPGTIKIDKNLTSIKRARKIAVNWMRSNPEPDPDES